MKVIILKKYVFRDGAWIHVFHITDKQIIVLRLIFRILRVLSIRQRSECSCFRMPGSNRFTMLQAFQVIQIKCFAVNCTVLFRFGTPITMCGGPDSPYDPHPILKKLRLRQIFCQDTTCLRGIPSGVEGGGHKGCQTPYKLL